MSSSSTELSKWVCPVSKGVGGWNPQVVAPQPCWNRVPAPRPGTHGPVLSDSGQVSSLLICSLPSRPAGTTRISPKCQSLCGLLLSHLLPFLSGTPSLHLFPFKKGLTCHFPLKTFASSLAAKSGLPPVSHWLLHRVVLSFLGSVSTFLTRLWTYWEVDSWAFISPPYHLSRKRIIGSQ